MQLLYSHFFFCISKTFVDRSKRWKWKSRLTLDWIDSNDFHLTRNGLERFSFDHKAMLRNVRCLGNGTSLVMRNKGNSNWSYHDQAWSVAQTSKKSVSNHDENVKFYQSKSDERHAHTKRRLYTMPIYAEHRFLSSFRLASHRNVDKVSAKLKQFFMNENCYKIYFCKHLQKALITFHEVQRGNFLLLFVFGFEFIFDYKTQKIIEQKFFFLVQKQSLLIAGCLIYTWNFADSVGVSNPCHDFFTSRQESADWDNFLVWLELSS